MPEFESSGSLAGSLIAASPCLIDPNFVATVVLVTAHAENAGAMGVIINRPSGESLGSFRNDVESHFLRNLPVYFGGPVSTEEIILAAWRWNHQAEHFRLYFGLDPQRLEALVKSDPAIEARAFLGYAGWGIHQLEGEMQRHDWAVCPFIPLFGKVSPGLLWRTVVKSVRPDWGVLADGPEDPSLN